MPSIVTYKYIKQNPDIMEYIRRADKALEALKVRIRVQAHNVPAVELTEFAVGLGLLI